MRDDIIPRKLEGVSNLVDRAAERLHPGARPGKDAERMDPVIIGAFPYFIAICVLMWTCIMVYIGDYRFSKMIEILCLVFVMCFAAIGIPCSCIMEKGVFSRWAMLALTLIMTCVLWMSGLFMGQVYYADAISNTFAAMGINLDTTWEFVLGFLGTLGILFFTSVGVLTVICSYMRTYMPGVFLTMNDHAAEGVRGKAEAFFMVPDIIDVKEVVLDPRVSIHRFDLGGSMSITLYLFILGLLVSSYLFVNPLLITVMGWQTMLAVTLMLTMFTPALVLPWQIVRGVGAKVRSDAPRDYYLWTGAKKRLFSAFMTLGVFMMMFVLSVYLGNSIADIIRTYVSFLIPLFATSLIYGAIYVNNFDMGVRSAICRRFMDNDGGGEDS